jgi:undecaprenyl-diphosphatase
MIVKELLGVDGEGFLDFTVTVHLATVLSTLVVFWKPICKLFAGFFKFKYNDETDYIFKILVSMIPVALVGFLLKDQVEALFGDSLTTVAVCLLVTAALLFLSDVFGSRSIAETSGTYSGPSKYRNGISFWQSFVVGIGQAFAVAPGLSRSGTTIATGLLCGVKREVMAQFSFLMVLIPIIGEQALDVLKAATGHAELGGGLSPVCLIVGFISAFLAGLFACKAMVALVKRAKLGWFALYCLVVAVLIFIFA